MTLLKRLMSEEDGQGTVEYILMVGLVVFGIWAAAAVTGVDEAITALWASISGELTTANLNGD